MSLDQMRDPTMQKLAKIGIYLNPYVLFELILDGLQFTINKTFLSKTLITFVAHLVTLPLGT